MIENKKRSDNNAADYEQLGYWEPLTLGEQLRSAASRYKNKIAVVEDDIRLTYEELDKTADKLAAGLSGMGIQAGDNVVVQLPNCISFITVCFALFRIGARPVLALPSHREAELDAVFNLAEPVAYIIPKTFLGFDYEKIADTLTKRYSSVKLVITDGKGENSIDINDIPIPAIDFGDVPSYKSTALFLLSGGTTGIPKMISKSHTAYAYNAKATAKRCGLTAQSVYLAVLSIAHDYPLCCPGVIGTLLCGGTVALCKTSSYDEAFPLIEKERVTIIAVVPAVINVWLETLEWDTSVDVSSLEVILVGAAKLEKDIAKRIISRMGCRLQQGYGLGEGITCFTSPDDPEDIACSCQGRPVSEADEIKIVDESGNEVAGGEFGELIERGPYTFSGYYKAPELNRQCFTADGFFRTGDRARITPEGNIQIEGRIKEQINRAGENVVPAEIELYLRKHPNIKDASVISLPDETLGERTCAFLITDGNMLGLADICKFLKDMGVARYKIPDQIELIECLPFTNVGKVDKKKLREYAQTI